MTDRVFVSRYGAGDNITAAQYIAEIMCERLARKDKEDLPVKFWNTPKWQRTFKQQILAAHSILKLHKADAIIAALKKTPTVLSLRAEWLQPIIQECQQKLKIVITTIDKLEVASTTEKPRETFVTKKSTLSKLRDLDG